MEKAKVEIGASNFYCRQSCFICGRDERQDGIELRIRTPGMGKGDIPFFVCPICQGMAEKNSVYTTSIPNYSKKWPDMLRGQALALRAWAADLDRIATMEFVLPTAEEWDKAINQRAKWDKEMRDDQEKIKAPIEIKAAEDGFPF